jgi:NADPH:quinone reductase-like Zn-dependent oxidoreductase
MKAIRKTRAAAGAKPLDIPVPKIGPRDLLVEVKAAAIRKSDVDVFEWTPLVQAANTLAQTIKDRFSFHLPLPPSGVLGPIRLFR